MYSMAPPCSKAYVNKYIYSMAPPCYKHCFAMKTKSILVSSVFSYLGPLGGYNEESILGGNFGGND